MTDITERSNPMRRQFGCSQPTTPRNDACDRRIISPLFKIV